MILIFACLLQIAGGRARLEAGSASPTLTLETLATGLERPVTVADPGDGSGRLFIAQQNGLILIFDGDEVLPTPFLDLRPLVTCCGDRGLLGFNFHPGYAANGFFFVNYSDGGGDTALVRYSVSQADPDVADPGSAESVLQLAQPTQSHNGNHLAFGPDGFLYVAMGDGGTPGDAANNAQDLGVLYGKILRLDVDGAPPGAGYGIPPGNPFVGDPRARDEIWAYGLRNPWRFSFDRATGDLWIADVGQEEREEVDFQPAASAGGENYGWRRMEGSLCFDPPQDCQDDSLTLPLLEYSHAFGCSVTGGFRYRGQLYPALDGVYLFGDFCSGTIWGAVGTCAGWSFFRLLETGFGIVSFGEDETGELYVVEFSVTNGKIHRLAAAGSAPGIFSDCFESGDLGAWNGGG